MARVPTRDSFGSTGGGAGFTARANSGVISTEAATIGARQVQEMGRAVQTAADTAIDIKIDAQKAANELRVADAVNRARQSALDAAYNPDTGYLKLRGQDALYRPDGTSLPDEYGSAYDKNLSEIEGTLGNDAQKRAFQLQAASLSTGFRGDVQQHMFKEYVSYNSSVADGTIKLAQEEAGLNWNNPAKIEDSIYGIKDPITGERTGGLRQAIYNKGKLTGMSATEQDAVALEAESKVHTSVVVSALTNNNATYATGYFEKYKGDMTAADVLKVQGQINDQLDANIALGGVRGASAEYASSFAPSDMDRLSNIVLQQESGGRRYDNTGKIITSPKGARGEMQVMPHTAKDPGFGVKPSDGTPDDDARMGRDYLSAMVKKYGDVTMATAAYNAGPGKLDEAMAKAKKDGKESEWLSYLPKETRDYATNATKKFTAGAGRPDLPSKLDFVNAALNKLGDNPRAEATAKTRDAAEKQYELMVADRKTRSENALNSAQQELLENGGNLLALTPETRMALNSNDPENYKKATEFAKVVMNPVATNPESYAVASLYPDELAKMSDPLFLQFLKTNFSTDDQAKVITLRQEAQTGKSDTGTSSINTAALNTALEGRLESIGINPKPTKGTFGSEAGYQAAMAKVGSIQRIIRNDIYEQQQQLGRKLSPEEIDQRMDKLFTTSAPLKQSLFGSDWLWPDTTRPVLQMTIDDISTPDLVKIKRNLVLRGIANPDDNLILRTYQQWELNKNANRKS